MDFATYLPARLRELGMTQAEFSRQIHVSNSAVSNWTRGMRPTGRDRLRAIARTLEEDYDKVVEFVNGSPGSRPGVAATAAAPGPADSAALRERLSSALDRIAPESLAELVGYAEYLGMKQFRDDWQRFALAQLESAYGEGEPDYDIADLKPFR